MSSHESGLLLRSCEIPTISMMRRINQIVVSITWKMRNVFGLRLCRANITIDVRSRTRQRTKRHMRTTTTPIAPPLIAISESCVLTITRAAMYITSMSIIKIHLTTQKGIRTRLSHRVLLSAPKAVSPEETGIFVLM